MRRGGIRTRRGSRPSPNRQTERVHSNRRHRYEGVMFAALAIAVAAGVMFGLDLLPLRPLGLGLVMFAAGMIFAAEILRRP